MLLQSYNVVSNLTLVNLVSLVNYINSSLFVYAAEKHGLNRQAVINHCS